MSQKKADNDSQTVGATLDVGSGGARRDVMEPHDSRELLDAGPPRSRPAAPRSKNSTATVDGSDAFAKQETISATISNSEKTRSPTQGAARLEQRLNE